MNETEQLGLKDSEKQQNNLILNFKRSLCDNLEKGWI